MSPALRRWLVSMALVATAAVWGATFVMVKNAVAAYPVWSFLGWRFAIASVAFCALFPSTLRRLNRGTVLAGVVAGAFLTAGYVFQTLGLARTSPSKAAFTTGMFVVFTPPLQAFVLRRVPRWPAWLGILPAVTGLWLLSGGTALGGWNAGDGLVLLCALAYSGHLIALGRFGRHHDTGVLTLVQLVTVAVVCGVVGAATEQPGLPTGTSVWVALAVTGIVASALAFAVQTYAQKRLSPTRTALILVCEPAFGGLFGWLLAHEVLGPRELAGAALILSGMVASEVLSVVVARRDEGEMLAPALEGPPARLLETDGGREG